MTTAKMHRLRVFETIAPHTETQTLPLSALLDAPRRLAADVDSPIDVPGFDNSSMDGYALAAATLDELAAGSGPDAHQGPDAQRQARTQSDPRTQREPAVGGDPQAHPDPTEPFGPIPVRGRVAAGARGRPVDEGTAGEIMTGAPLPAGTDKIGRAHV